MTLPSSLLAVMLRSETGININSAKFLQMSRFVFDAHVMQILIVVFVFLLIYVYFNLQVPEPPGRSQDRATS